MSSSTNNVISPFFNGCQLVLDLSPRPEENEPKDPSRISTSRALIKFSQVYRNSGGKVDFKVRRGKQYHPNYSMVSAEKIVLR